MSEKMLMASLDGITLLPPGHVGTIKTYLERTAPPQTSSPLPADVRLDRLQGRDQARYRTLFTALGQRWLWWSRLLLSQKDLAAILDAPATEAFAIVRDGADIGLMEWDFSRPDEPELAFLGLLDQATGRGLGSRLMDATLLRMFQQPITRVRLNTCTFDHPGALDFYRKCGFAVVAQAVEIVPDPRQTGLLPPSAAPHVPIL